MYVYMNVYVYMYIYTHIYMYIQMYKLSLNRQYGTNTNLPIGLN